MAETRDVALQDAAIIDAAGRHQRPLHVNRQVAQVQWLPGMCRGQDQHHQGSQQNGREDQQSKVPPPGTCRNPMGHFWP